MATGIFPLLLGYFRWGLHLSSTEVCLRSRRFTIEITNGSNKTLIGRIEKGLDFLGYHFSPEGLSMAEKTIENFLTRAVRLYEQEREEPWGSPRLGLAFTAPTLNLLMLVSFISVVGTTPRKALD
jgi:hypothetical protein